MLKKRTLLRSQRKQVFEILRAADLEPADFDWSKERVDETRVSRLSYRQGDYYFQFSSYEMGGRCIACPGGYQFIEYDYPKGWTEQASPTPSPPVARWDRDITPTGSVSTTGSP